MKERQLHLLIFSLLCKTAKAISSFRQRISICRHHLNTKSIGQTEAIPLFRKSLKAPSSVGPPMQLTIFLFYLVMAGFCFKRSCEHLKPCLSITSTYFISSADNCLCCS